MTRLQIRRMIIGYIIGGHALAIVGAYLTAKGILAGSFALLFTGLMLILGAACLFINAVGMRIKSKLNWLKD